MNTMAFPEMFLRLGAAALVGAVIGLNRELTHKPAGMRTHALVSLGAALITLISVEYAVGATPRDDGAVLRAIQGIVTGIGFIGGGVILRSPQERTVRGLTTAASIWIVAGLGMACGLGAWEAVAITVALALAVLVMGDRIDSWIQRRNGREGHEGRFGRNSRLGD
jgi:putative Mg2+ transporter-C (MgtC) family protein